MRLRNGVLLLATATAFLFSNAHADAQAKVAVCTACHGADGNSVNPIWPNLAGQNAPYIAQQLRAYKSGARENPSMSPMAAGVKDADIDEIAAHYAAQPLKVAALAEGDYSAAEKLYRGGDSERGIPACMACHGPSGAGNAPAKYPALRGQHAAYTSLQLKAYRDGTRANDPQQIMRDVAQRLTDEDIEQLAQYLSALY